MKVILLALALAGCGSTPGHRSPLLPSEFHLIATRSEFDSSGTIDRRDGPGDYDQEGTSTGYTFGFGFTWNLVSPRPQRHPLPENYEFPPRLPTPAAPAVSLPTPSPVQPSPANEGGESSIVLQLAGALTALIMAIVAWIKRSLFSQAYGWARGNRPGDCPPNDEPPPD